MMLSEFFHLLKLRFTVSLKNFFEYVKVVFYYYRNSNFRKIDIFLLRHYILNNPFQVCKKFLKQKGVKDLYAYGETPLTTLDKIANEIDIKPTDVFFELGAGRGRSCFWIHCFRKCRVVGIEFVPEFVNIARKTIAHKDVKDVTFVYRNILDADLSEATVIYFYGTCSEQNIIEELIEKLKKVRSGTKIVTVSYPLSSYTEEPLFEEIKTFSAEFTWGTTNVYVVRRV